MIRSIILEILLRSKNKKKYQKYTSNFGPEEIIVICIHKDIYIERERERKEEHCDLVLLYLIIIELIALFIR